MSDSAQQTPSSFWTDLAQPYRGRFLWPLAASMPILFGFIGYTWHTQTPLEDLHWVPENIGAVILLANIVYGTVLFCRGTLFTFQTMGIHLGIIKGALKAVRGEKRHTTSKLSGADIRQMLTPIGLIFSHVFVANLIFLPSALLINGPYISV